MNPILCPGCRANTVPAVSWDFHDRLVDVTTCDECRHAGLLCMRLPVTAMAALELPTETVRHRDGLVEFTS